MDFSPISCFCLIILVSACQSTFTRKMSYTLNPNCQKMCEHYKTNSSEEFNNIVHVKGSHDKDILHYVWSTVGAPTVLIAKTDTNVTMKVDWKKLFANDSSGAVKFSGKVYYSFAAIMSKIYEYNDTKDKAEITDKSKVLIYDLSKLTWKNVRNTLKESSKSVDATFISTNYSEPLLHEGTVKIKMSASGIGQRMEDSPHQFWTANSSLVDFTIDGLKAHYMYSRLIAEMIFISLDNSGHEKFKQEIDYDVQASIDDEYTPSVFNTINLESPECKHAKRGGYMQFKPIAYLSSKRKYDNSTAMTADHIDSKMNPKIVPFGIAKAYFGSDMKDAKMANLTVKFGVATGTDYYQTSNYSSWTMVVGYGEAPKDEISLTVILVVIIGLGLPVLMLIGGIIYRIVIKLRGNDRGQMLIVHVDE